MEYTGIFRLLLFLVVGGFGCALFLHWHSVARSALAIIVAGCAFIAYTSSGFVGVALLTSILAVMPVVLAVIVRTVMFAVASCVRRKYGAFTYAPISIRDTYKNFWECL